MTTTHADTQQDQPRELRSRLALRARLLELCGAAGIVTPGPASERYIVDPGDCNHPGRSCLFDGEVPDMEPPMVQLTCTVCGSSICAPISPLYLVRHGGPRGPESDSVMSPKIGGA